MIISEREIGPCGVCGSRPITIYHNFMHVVVPAEITLLPVSISQVVGLSRIELQVVDKIEQGSSVPMSVDIYDTLGQSLDASVLPFIQLQPVLGSSVVRVSVVSVTQHMVEGVTLGETTISFSAATIKSSVVQIQVFAPLKLSPRNITLVLGATLQVVT